MKTNRLPLCVEITDVYSETVSVTTDAADGTYTNHIALKASLISPFL
jgi:hypothetical protein